MTQLLNIYVHTKFLSLCFLLSQMCTAQCEWWITNKLDSMVNYENNQIQLNYQISVVYYIWL